MSILQEERKSPQRFMSESIFNPTKGMSNASLETKETNLVATEERVIIQTATIDLKNGIKQSVRVLLDSGSQRTYISKDITDKLKLL